MPADSLLTFGFGLLGGVAALGAGLYLGVRFLRRARARARTLLHDSRAEAENKQREILLGAQEHALALQGEADQRERELEERESVLERRVREVEKRASEVGRDEGRLERRRAQVERLASSSAMRMYTSYNGIRSTGTD